MNELILCFSLSEDETLSENTIDYIPGQKGRKHDSDQDYKIFINETETERPHFHLMATKNHKIKTTAGLRDDVRIRLDVNEYCDVGGIDREILYRLDEAIERIYLPDLPYKRKIFEDLELKETKQYSGWEICKEYWNYYNPKQKIEITKKPNYRFLLPSSKGQEKKQGDL